MYLPNHFAVTDTDEIKRFIEAVRLGAMITHDDEGYFGTHLPWIFDGKAEVGSTMIGHVARANPHWKHFAAGRQAMVIFTGANAYVTPSCYPTKQETHKIVPTWAYQAVHITGRVESFDDPTELEAAVEALSDAMERPQPQPWSVDEAPRDYLEMMLKGIVGIRLTIEKIEAKYKLDQNKKEQDRLGAAGGLHSLGTESGAALAKAMTRA